MHSCHATQNSIGIDVLRERTDACHGLPLCRSRISAQLQVWRFTSLKFRHVAHRYVSIWLSDLRQPAHLSAAPKCHSPKLYGWPSYGGQCGVGCAGKPTHSSPQPRHSPPLPGTRNRSHQIVALKPSPPWCAAIALSHSVQCKMQQQQTAKGMRQWQSQAISKHVRSACSRPPWHLSAA